MSGLQSHDFERATNPLDVLEQIVSANEWAFERRSDSEMAAEAPGKWCDYGLYFSWSHEISAMSFTCAFDLKVPAGARAKLFELLGLPPGELAALSENLRLASAPSSANDAAQLAPLLPQRIDQLVWMGLSPASLAVLRPHITLLPISTPVNLNTASVEELDALPKVGPVLAQRIVDWRKEHGLFKSVEELDAVDGVGPKMLETLLPLVGI